MPKASPALFTRYEFTEEERYAAAAFTDLQRAFIHNERAIAAEEKATMPFSSEDIIGTARKDGFFQGMIAAYTFLLETNEAARSMLRKLQAEVDIQREPVREQEQRDLSMIFAPSVDLGIRS